MLSEMKIPAEQWSESYNLARDYLPFLSDRVYLKLKIKLNWNKNQSH